MPLGPRILNFNDFFVEPQMPISIKNESFGQTGGTSSMINVFDIKRELGIFSSFKNESQKSIQLFS